jgi:hypothetical protein
LLKAEKFNVATAAVYFSIILLAIKLLVSANFESSDLEVVEDKTLSYLCDFGIIACCLLSFRIVHQKFYFIFKYFLLVFFTFSLSTIYHDGSFFEAIKSLLRLFVPFLFFSVISSYFYFRRNELVSISKFMIFFIIILTLIGLAILPPSSNRWDETNEGLWWPAYFSGLHTTTYVVIASSFVVFSMYKIGAFPRYVAILFFVTTFLAVAFGWGVRTTTLSMIVLVTTSIYYDKFSHNLNVKMVVQVALLLLTLFYAFTLFDWDKMNAMSSGRLSMYEFKYYQLIDNSLLSWFIGNGAGSDIVETDFWWWEAKGSHSDLITFLVEGGLVYLVSFLLILRRLAAIVPTQACKSIVFALLITSAFSNGFFVRPLALYFVLFSLSLLYVKNDRISKVY